MTVARNLSRARRPLYRTAARLGDLQAVLSGPGPMVKRAVRKQAYRSLNHALRSVLR